MKKPIEEGMNFTLAVDEMLQMNDVMLINFNSDKASFIAKVPDLKDPFLDKWQESTDSLSSVDSDSEYTNAQLLLTQDLNDLMVSVRDHIQTIFFYVDRAFPGNQAVLSYFGKNQYENARKDPMKLVDLILNALDVSQEPLYKDALDAKGLNQAVISDIKTAVDNLNKKNKERNAFINGRKLATQSRIKTLNIIWGYMTAVSNASKLVYKTDYAKQQQYLLYPPKPKGKEDMNAKPEAQ